MNDPEFDPYRLHQASLGTDQDDKGSAISKFPKVAPS